MINILYMTTMNNMNNIKKRIIIMDKIKKNNMNKIKKSKMNKN
jgi:hypothetical protein